MRAFVTGAGVVSSKGAGLPSLLSAIRSTSHSFEPLQLFEAGADGPLPAGQYTGRLPEGEHAGTPLPRTHLLALMAALEALGDGAEAPDAVVLGGTTGGIPTTETLVLNERVAEADFSLHGTGTVAQFLAQHLGCTGPALTISTACSSSAVALKLGLQMVRSGSYRRVLAGGADALCRLTYFGFGLLQLIDPQGSRPLDKSRAGMTVSEGAALLLLEGGAKAPARALGELRGGGLSCDAHHATAPHPEGAGALSAMVQALEDGGLKAGQVDYLNLHGTGTRDNDLSEARAVKTLFPEGPPPLSSTKGIFGHSLAAAGAVEAVISLLSISEGLLPPNARLDEPDPETGLEPVREPGPAELSSVLSNSLGFGGNNASLLFTGNDWQPREAESVPGAPASFRVRRAACFTGAGDLEQSFDALCQGRVVAGVLDGKQVVSALPPRSVRRIKRLPRLVLALGHDLLSQDTDSNPAEVFFGTGYGPLSETHNFLSKLFKSEQRLSSPTDFVGSVHNAPAGQLAMRYKARGANVTATGGDDSLEQALFMALALSRDEGDVLLVGADEHHPQLSPLFDPSAGAGVVPADGGGALLLSRDSDSGNELSQLLLVSRPSRSQDLPGLLEQTLGPADGLVRRYGAVLLGLPGATRAKDLPHLRSYFDSAQSGPALVDYRPLLGEFATVSACALALANHGLSCDRMFSESGELIDLAGRGILLVNLGAHLSLVELQP